MEKIKPTRYDLITLSEDYKAREKKEFKEIRLTKTQVIVDYFLEVNCVKSTANHFKMSVDTINSILIQTGLL